MNNDSARDKAMDKLVEAKLRSGLIPGGPSCPDAEVLAAFFERTLTSRERANCESHIASCALCQEQVAVLARLAEADEPAPASGKAGEPARAAGINWFRWAWAGPALAAVLVIGIYVGGPFRNEIRQTPGPKSRIEKSVTAQPTAAPYAAEDEKKNKPKPAGSESGSTRTREPAAKNSTDLNQRADALAGKPARAQNEPASAGSLGGTSTREESSPKTKSEGLKRPAPTPAVVQPAAPSSNTVAPTVTGAIVTPSERAALAKDDRGQAAGVGGTASINGGTGSGISEEHSNRTPANQPMGDFSARRRTPQSSGPQSVPPPPPEKAPSSKSTVQVEIVAKKEAQTTDAERDKLSENTREKQVTNPSVSITAASQGLMAKPVGSIPIWRVGRRGLIQKINEAGKWKKQKSSVKADLYAVTSPSAEVGWAVGQAGTVLRTTDGGKTWSQVSKPTTEDLTAVTATSDHTASATARSGEAFKTVDGGNSWTASAK